jgi:hypothetical protein
MRRPVRGTPVTRPKNPHDALCGMRDAAPLFRTAVSIVPQSRSESDMRAHRAGGEFGGRTFGWRDDDAQELQPRRAAQGTVLASVL